MVSYLSGILGYSHSEMYYSIIGTQNCTMETCITKRSTYVLCSLQHLLSQNTTYERRGVKKKRQTYPVRPHLRLTLFFSCVCWLFTKSNTSAPNGRTTGLQPPPSPPPLPPKTAISIAHRWQRRRHDAATWLAVTSSATVARGNIITFLLLCASVLARIVAA